MRSCLWLRLITLGLLVAGLRGQASAMASRTQATKSISVSPTPARVAPLPHLPGWTIEGGWSRTREDALEAALDEARLAVVAYLRKQHPPILWTPSKDYIRERLLRDLPPGATFKPATEGGQHERITLNGRVTLEEVRQFDQQLIGEGAEGQLRRLAIRVEVSPGDREDILRQEQLYQDQLRRARAEGRQSLAARVLAALVALLAVVAGYLRMEDATKGYYTTLLRALAVTFLALVGASLWLLS